MKPSLKFSLLVALLLLSTACRKGNRKIDPEFMPYVDQFESDAKAHRKAIHVQSNVRFGSTDRSKGQVGFCDGWGSVTIGREFWDVATERARIALVYHELGHCELGRAH